MMQADGDPVRDQRPHNLQLTVLRDSLLEVYDENIVRSENNHHNVSRWLNETMSSSKFEEAIAFERDMRRMMGGDFR